MAAVLVWALSIGIGLSISRQSLWIDSFSTAAIAAQESPFEALRFATMHLGSEALMPAWVVIVNLVAHVLGTSELALRAINALWLGLAVYLLSRVGPRRTNIGPAISLAVLPFAWYYGNEARPYALQLLIGAMFLLAMWRLYEGIAQGAGSPKLLRARRLMVFVVISSVLVGLTTAIVVAGMLFASLLFFRKYSGRWLLSRANLVLLAVGCLPSLAWYAWLVLHGTSGAKLWNVGIANLAFALYEITGFAGLGPGRLALRLAGLTGLGGIANSLRPFAPWLAIHGVLVVAALALVGARLLAGPGAEKNAPWPFVAISVGASLAGAATLFVAAILTGFPVWGRHFAPMVPVVVGSLGLAMQSMLERRNRLLGLTSVVAAALLVTLSASSGLVRFSERHAVEDYRGAVALAGQATRTGLAVAWYADDRALEYYESELPSKTEISVGHITASRKSTAVFVSKPDISDPGSQVASLVKSGGAIRCQSHIRGFDILVIASDPATTGCNLIGLARAK